MASSGEKLYFSRSTDFSSRLLSRHSSKLQCRLSIASGLLWRLAARVCTVPVMQQAAKTSIGLSLAGSQIYFHRITRTFV
jgi:hypothetical protein